MSIAKHILSWYESTRRKLPWRDTRDPYLIWLSEIILQQTRVDQGLDYYNKFSKKYPTVQKLADAQEKEVLKLWQGLGYYSRARNLLFAANQVISEYNGTFPGSYESLKELKGVGDYTAAAIASISFNEIVPVVDGNVKRVISRLFGVSASGSELHNEVKILMGELIDPDSPGDFNQAVMEFGALQCTPQNPQCTECIFNKECFAYNHNLVDALPARSLKNKPRILYFNYLVMINHGKRKQIIIKKRQEKGIWRNLYDFPLLETDSEVSESDVSQLNPWKGFLGNEHSVSICSKEYKHQLSHRTILARFHIIYVENLNEMKRPPDWELISLSELATFPVPRLIDRFLKEYNLLA